MREETEKKTGAMKMVLAVLQGDDYADTVDELNRDGFSATILSSTGGFLKEKECDNYDRCGGEQAANGAGYPQALCGQPAAAVLRDHGNWYGLSVCPAGAGAGPGRRRGCVCAGSGTV